MIIREEEPSDYDAVRELVAAAFEQRAEAELIDDLRADGDLVYGAVCIRDDEIIGYAAFSRMTAPFAALGLGPVATATLHRCSGAASALIRWGLARAAREGWRAVFVLGDPAFYRRFGFDAALARGFASPYAGPHFMALALGELLPPPSGTAAYARAFGRFERQ